MAPSQQLIHYGLFIRYEALHCCMATTVDALEVFSNRQDFYVEM